MTGPPLTRLQRLKSMGYEEGAVPTMTIQYAGGKCVRLFNRDWVDGLSDKDFEIILKHEEMHAEAFAAHHPDEHIFYL